MRMKEEWQAVIKLSTQLLAAWLTFQLKTRETRQANLVSHATWPCKSRQGEGEFNTMGVLKRNLRSASL